MTDHAIAVVALAIAAVDMIVGAFGLYYLVEIKNDDRAMRIAAEDSLKAQLEYLGLRRKWYEARTKKKDNEKIQPRPEDGASTNSM